MLTPRPGTRLISLVKPFCPTRQPRMLSMMKALVYNGANQIALENRAKPTTKSPTDAIVKLSHSTICGTDLHIIKGDVPSCTPGRILGHEGVGVIEEVGQGVSHFKQ